MNRKPNTCDDRCEHWVGTAVGPACDFYKIDFLSEYPGNKDWLEPNLFKNCPHWKKHHKLTFELKEAGFTDESCRRPEYIKYILDNYGYETITPNQQRAFQLYQINKKIKLMDGETLCGHPSTEWENFGEYCKCKICGRIDINWIKSEPRDELDE